MTEHLSAKKVSESRAVKASIVLPPDTNTHRTMFGGKVMAYIDDIAAISAMRHCRKRVVTASTDSVDFLNPIKEGDSICLESFVTWTHKTSMEVFVKVVAEDLLTGQRVLCATSFLTFVALDPDNRPAPVPHVIPETKEEKDLYDSAPQRADARRARRAESKKHAEMFNPKKPWDR
ncbi:acyl-CoA thioesterase [Tumebacillus avium]|uniref:Acyl-CoA thioesterase n=1 Tax=Tumebacillus avium TaxID=1903704 RepID=A0A1Y0IMT5_9BACL|nr:acyl-CoA thioesterase [Tumebacillus avium]ARU61838.1 acyl-CoA thioesterase [Tumebacillus avium]